MSNLPKVRWKKNEFGQDRLQYLEEEVVMDKKLPNIVSHVNFVYKDVPTVESWNK